MEAISLELVTEIARQLDAAFDVSRLRQVSRAFAYAASPVLFHNIQVINTVECLNQLSEFQNRSSALASTARHLTVHHAIWPQLRSLDDWSNHSLALSHKYLSERAKMLAYSAYRQFMDQETSRTFGTDICRLIRILGMFPNLTSLTLSHIHTWRWVKLRNDHYDKLRQRIHMVPFFEAKVEDLAYTLLLILPNFPQITKLNIPSILDMREGEWRVTNESILSLNVGNLVVRGYNHHQIHCFLQSFPNLQELILATESEGQISEQRIVLCSLYWPNLRRVHLRHLWTSEDDLISFIERHQLEQLALRSVTLVDSSWESFFVRLSSLSIRPSRSVVCITAAGIHFPLKEAATLYSRWPIGHAYSLRPRIYVLFSDTVCQEEARDSSSTDRNNQDFWFGA